MSPFLKSYLRYLWQSKNEHGVHSPFVFNLVTQCLYDKKQYAEYAHLKDHRKLLLENKSTIEVTDFGAGSKVFKSNIRAINQIAKKAGISAKRAQLLYRIVKYLQPEYILEIGTSVGLGTAALALGNPTAKITTLEGCPNTSATANENFQNSKFHPETSGPNSNITFVNTEFESYLKNLKPETIDFIYFDGNHSKKATIDYFNLLLPTTTNDTVWIFDDIHWSAGMEEAWEIIKNHPKVTVTIDTFQWGLVFFRTEQEKEHFTIRC
ncbi:MAG: class I SAM-dependent methyltransferase [Flavobacterium sp.]|nr:class I SAM-dependent methyltransferase [Flavobacterium sp.]